MLIAWTESRGGDRVFSEAMACGRGAASPSPSSRPRASPSTAPRACASSATASAPGSRSIPNLVIPDESLSIDEGAIKPWGPKVSEKTGWSHGFRGQIVAQLGIDFDKPWNEGSEAQRRRCCSTARASAVQGAVWKGKSGVQGLQFEQTWEGVLPRLMRRFMQTGSERAKRWYAQFIGDTTAARPAAAPAAARERRGARRHEHSSSSCRRSPSRRRG